MNPLRNHSPLQKDQPLILYELNEIPWRVIDWYVQQRPSSTFAALVNSSETYTTVTKDEGELHPWTTWPTLHRGVYNTRHNIRFINQDLKEADRFPPVWKTVREAGKKVGVFGSLQSYSALHDGYTFYVPDTFAPGCKTWPPEYSAFQRFNLRQTQQDGAQASPVTIDSSVMSDVFNMLRTGLSIKVCRTLAMHLANERLNPLYRSRRSVLQAVVAFDIFKHALNKTRPDFCTFFTNHLAGMMHRYWKYTFPEDFRFTVRSSTDKFYAGSIRFAMDVADTQLSYLIKYVDSRGGVLMLASSMGQEAIDRGEYHGEWRIKDVPKFLSSIGWTSPVQNLLAMQPDFNFAFDSEADAKRFMELTACLVDENNASIWKKGRQIGATINLGLSPSKEAVLAGTVTLSPPGKPRRKLKIADMGIQILNRDPGTGYHQPRGVLLLYGAEIKHDDARTEIELTAVRSSILQMMDLRQEACTSNPDDQRSDLIQA